MFRCVFFDVGDTLVDEKGFFRGAHIEAVRVVLERFGFRKSRDEIVRALKLTRILIDEFWGRNVSFFRGSL